MAAIVAAAIQTVIITAAIIGVAIIDATIGTATIAPAAGGISSAGPMIVTTLIGTPGAGAILGHTNRKDRQTELVA
ncbi:hypothetical protein [Paralcaligenes ureilyticus]|uniref:hypothetical protein n=1 Tax=Paralcaligenes ureilyticus TaxID=627131 RepID=UPI0014055DAA|nr:hypothetical protein [Paralcaligenes ureilyticus]